MSSAPVHAGDAGFARDEGLSARIREREAAIGAAFREAVLVAATHSDRARVPAAAVGDLLTAFHLESPREAALLAIPAAASLARPAISGYRVGAVGVTTRGDLILGGNLEFAGASIHHTVHGEGFVTLRARALGMHLESLAISQARPCAHCRQVLAEMAWAETLRIVDPAGHDLALEALYPWPFVPADLDRSPAGVRPSGGGHAPGAVRVAGPELAQSVADALARAGARAHAPYSGEPAAILLLAADGRTSSGAVLESVAFNPTIGPLQDALVDAVATGIELDTISDAWLATMPGARVDHLNPTRDLLAAVAPGARLHATYWA